MSSTMMDPGLHSLVAIARFHQLPAEPEQLSHEFGIPGKAFTDTEILLAAKALTLKAKQLTLSILSLVKYRKLFSEVLIASFFLQIFALVIPLFFQVVMDKVLVHRGFTTLDVLSIGFFIVVVFEALLGGIRNYTFSHTTNRVDVELGSRLFNHLLSLPLSYFESRQVGQNVARVGELDTIPLWLMVKRSN